MLALSYLLTMTGGAVLGIMMLGGPPQKCSSGSENTRVPDTEVGAVQEPDTEVRKADHVDANSDDDDIVTEPLPRCDNEQPGRLKPFVDSCTCCNKVYDDAHEMSQRHVQRAAVVAGLDALCGVVAWRKIYEGVVLNDDISAVEGGYVTQAGMERFWGADVNLVGPRIFKLLRDQEFVSFKTRRHGSMTKVPSRHITGAATGVVPYDPNGSCYTPQGSIFIRWETLPEGKDYAVDLQNSALFQIQEHKKGQSYWPVASISLDKSPVSQALQTMSPTWAICVYQALELPLVAWPLKPAAWAVEWVDVVDVD